MKFDAIYLLVFGLSVLNRTNAIGEVKPISKFLVTVTGGNSSAAEVLKKLQLLVASLNGRASDIDECRLIFKACDLTATCVNTLGSFRCVCNDGFIYEDGNISTCRDLDECLLGNNNCSQFATCKNLIGSYNCTCRDGFSGDGFVCSNNEKKKTKIISKEKDDNKDLSCLESKDSEDCNCRNNQHMLRCKPAFPIFVSCTTNSISLKITAEFYNDKKFRLKDFHLADSTCVGKESPPGLWVFSITGDLTSCSTYLSRNSTHVTYSNVLTNSARKGEVFVGPLVSFPFSCSYPVRNITVQLFAPFYLSSNVINIVGPSGNGTFVVKMNLFTDSTYSIINNNSIFAATDTLYVEVRLIADDASLVLFIKDCWATPSNDGNDVNRYKFISSGCRVPKAIAGTVRVTKNGVGKIGRFQSQVFGFVNFNTTYLHCTVDLCSTKLSRNCSANCGDVEYNRAMDRVKRSIDDHVLSLGPFRSVDESNGGIDIGTIFHRHQAIITAFIAVTAVMALIVIILIVHNKRIKRKMMSRANHTAESNPPSTSSSVTSVNSFGNTCGEVLTANELHLPVSGHVNDLTSL